MIRTSSLYCACAMLAAACAPVQSTTVTPQDASYADTLPTPPPTIPPGVFPLIALSSSVEGPLRSGEPFIVVARLEVLRQADSVELTIAMPEVSDARETGWGADFRRRPAGVRYPAMDSVVARLEPGETLERRIPLTIPAEGWYTVSIVARARGNVPTNEPVLREAYHSFHVWIGKEAGTVAAQADLTRYPLDAAMQAGPVVVFPGPNRVRQQILQAQTSPATSASIEGVVRGPGGVPVANAPVTLRAYRDACPGPPVAEEHVRTDAAGTYRASLRAWPSEPFTGCISVLVDPPRALRLRAGAARATARFAPNRASALARADVVLEPIVPIR